MGVDFALQKEMLPVFHIKNWARSMFEILA